MDIEKKDEIKPFLMPDGRKVFEVSRVEWWSSIYILAENEDQALDAYNWLWKNEQVKSEFLEMQPEVEVVEQSPYCDKQTVSENLIDSRNCSDS